jgi:hypothetical protein
LPEARCVIEPVPAGRQALRFCSVRLRFQGCVLWAPGQERS